MDSALVPPLAFIVLGASVSDSAHFTGDGPVAVADSDVHEAAAIAMTNTKSCSGPGARVIAGPLDIRSTSSMIGVIR
jgi:hypothetical protein